MAKKTRKDSPMPYDIENVYTIVLAIEDIIDAYSVEDIKAAFIQILKNFREG